MQKSSLKYLSIFLGIVFLVVAAYYWMTPANALAHFMPGFDPTMAKVHVKHGIGSLCIALAFFAYAWFQGGKKVTNSTDTQQH